MHEYPKRPKFFAIKFIRELLNSDLVSQFNPRTLIFLSFIVCREDDLRYSKAPSIWANELMNRLGVTKNTLMAVRDEAIESGLLHYEKGSRKVPSKYWVLDPDWMGIQSSVHSTLATPQSSTGSTLDNAQSSVHSTLNGSQSSAHSTEVSTEVSTLSNPNPKPKRKGASVSSQSSKNGSAKPNLDFEKFWGIWPRRRRTDKPRALKSFEKATKTIDAQLIISAASEYAASEVGQGDWVKAPATWLNNNCWEDSREAWNPNKLTHDTARRI